MPEENRAKRMTERERHREMAALSQQLERRFPPGCMIQLPDQRIMFGSIITAYNGWTRIVRYRVVGIYNGSGTLKVHRMKVPEFLKMVGEDVKPG